MSKSFLDNSNDVVVQSLRGTVRFTPSLALDPIEKIVFKRNLQSGTASKKVIMLSGGGSGHEPAHAGLIGEGMLDVAVVGNVFASPSASQVFKAIKAFPSEKGTLIITKNYTGDTLSFGLAIEKAKASGLECKLLIVGDDVAIPHKAGSTVGRRGLAGVVLVHKIAGAAAEEGASLEEVYSIAASVARNLATIGVSLQRCHVPGRMTTTEDEIGVSEQEYGMGIHNEPGVQRAPIASLNEVVRELLQRLLGESGIRQSFVLFAKTDDIVLTINNLGGLSQLELHAILDETTTQLSTDYGITPKRLIRGTLVSSLNGLGFSLTLLKLDERMIPLLDQVTDAPGWVAAIQPSTTKQPTDVRLRLPGYNQALTNERLKTYIVDPVKFEGILKEISKAITADEPAITHFDTIAGDGDCGETLLAGSNAIATALKQGKIDTSDLIAGLHKISNLVEASMGGTSGAIYGIYLNSLVSILNNSIEDDKGGKTAVLVAAAGAQALTELYKYTQARQGSRTLMDVLIPFIHSISSTPSEPQEALEAAIRGMESTKKMAASFGRASYVNAGIFQEEGGIPDAGALGLLSILSALVKVLDI